MKRKATTVTTFVLFLCASSSVSAQSWSFKETNFRGAFTSKVGKSPEGRVEAFIGRRSSMRNGERSSLRWLSRMIRRQPGANQYVIEWYVKSKGEWWNVATIFEPSRRLKIVAARSSVESNPPFADREWDVSTTEIHKAAHRGNSFRVFGKDDEL